MKAGHLQMPFGRVTRPVTQLSRCEGEGSVAKGKALFGPVEPGGQSFPCCQVRSFAEEVQANSKRPAVRRSWGHERGQRGKFRIANTRFCSRAARNAVSHCLPDAYEDS